MSGPERDDLIVSHKKDAERIAAKFWIRGGRVLDIEEVQAEALVCLIKVADDWNPLRAPDAFNREISKTAFGPFLAQRIKWWLIRWVSEQRGGGSVRHGEEIRAGNMDEPRFVGMTVGRAGKYQDEEVERSLPDARPTIEDELTSDSESLTGLIRGSSLAPRQKEILLLHGSGLDLRQIGERLGISRQRVHQLLPKIISTLKEELLRPKPKPKPVAAPSATSPCCRHCQRPIVAPKKFCNSTCYGAFVTTKVCIEPGCKKPCFKQKNPVTGAMGGRRCKWHQRLLRSIYTRTRRAERHVPVTAEQRRERGLKAAQTRLERYGSRAPVKAKTPKSLTSTVVIFDCPVCHLRCRRTKYATQPAPKFCSRACSNAGRRSISEADLQKYYVDQNMTLDQVGLKFGLDHSVVSNLLRLYGIEARPHTRRKTCKVNGCEQPVRDHRNKAGMVFGTMCEAHDKQYARECAMASAVAKDPLYGTRKCGRKAKPAPCPKCGTPCDSTRLATVHCLSGGKAWAEPKYTKRGSRSLVPV